MATTSVELKNHFLRLYQIACSDENFDRLELKQLYQFALQQGVDTGQLQNIMIDPVFSLNIPETLNERIEYLYDLAIMIRACQKVSENEFNTLRKFAKNFQFPDENILLICDFLLDCAKNELTTREVISAVKIRNEKSY